MGSTTPSNESSRDVLLVPDILERISDAFVAIDGCGRFAYVNARAAGFLGKSTETPASEAAGSDPPKPDCQPFPVDVGQLAGNGEGVREHHDADCDRWFEYRVAPAADGVWVFFNEITPRKHQERALNESRQRTERLAARLQAVASVASGVVGAGSYERLDRLIRDACTEVLPYQVLTFGLYDPGTHSLRFLPDWVEGVFQPEATIPLHGMPSEGVVRNRTSLLTLRSDDPRARGAVMLIGSRKLSESIIRTPIISGDRVLGVISVHSYTPDFYTADDVQALEAFAAVAARAIETIDLLAESRSTHEALRESEERFRSLTEVAADAILVMDPDSAVLYANPAAGELFGYTADEFLGMSVTQLMPERFRDAHRAGLRRYVATGERTIPWRGLEIVVLQRNGEELLVEIAFGSFTKNGRQLFTATMRSIAERKKSEEELRKSEERYRVLAGATSATIWRANADGRGVIEQGLGTDFSGRSANEAAPWSWLDAIHPDDRDASTAAWNAAVVSKTAFEFEHRLLRRDGEYRQMSVRAVPLLDPDGRIREWIGAHSDVTERRQMEEQLRQAHKMEAVGQLAGGIAHDFNNILMAITGFATFLQEIVSSEEAREYATEIQKAADRAAGLTRQLLAFGRRQMLRPGVLDLNELIERESAMLRRLVPARIRMSTATGKNLGRVEVDLVQMQQVLMNLVLNAADAMPDNGTLTIETGNRTIGERDRARYNFLKEGRYVSLNVKDTGCGISEEALARIFEPFFTTKAPGEGTGLGLSTAYGIVKQSGGYIWAESEKGKGCNFTVLLPRIDQRAVSSIDTAGVEATNSTHNAGTVLVAEDEDAVRSLVRLVLSRAGYTVLTAADGEEAIDVAAAHEGEIDLLLTDVVMPRMGGTELASRLRGSRPDLPVIFMSGYAGEALTRDGTLPSGSAFIQKPFKPSVLSTTVRDTLAGCSH